MSHVSRLIMLVTYLLGVVGTVVVVLLAFGPSFMRKLQLTPRGGLLFTCTLFLCAITSYLVSKATAAGKS
jgi:hypothetical protein